MKYLKILGQSPFKLAFIVTIFLQIVLVSVFFLLKSSNPALDIKSSSNKIALNKKNINNEVALLDVEKIDVEKKELSVKSVEKQVLEVKDLKVKEVEVKDLALGQIEPSKSESRDAVRKVIEAEVINAEVIKNDNVDQVKIIEEKNNIAYLNTNSVHTENVLSNFSKFSSPMEFSKVNLANIEDIAKVATKVLPIPEIQKIVKPKIISHKLQSGDTLASLWVKYTKDSRGSFHAANAFKDQGISLNSLKVGDIVEIQLSEEKDITALKKSLDEIRSILLTGDSKEGYKARILEANIIEKEEQKTMFIDSSIAMSAYNNGISYGVIDDIVDIFSHQLDFRRDIHPGDSFTVVYTKREYEDGKSVSPGPVKAASIKSSGKVMMAVRHVSSTGNTYYYDQNGKPIGSYFLRYPLKFSRISSVFNRNRFHPVLKRRRPHNGVDFAAPTGTPVRSIGPGIVQIASWKGGGGRTVKIKHNSRYSTAYLHLSKISKGIKVGARVKKGQVIGKVGMSGLATGPHLHFSLYDHGKYVDPLKAKLPVIQTDKDTIPREYLKKQIKLLNFSHEKLSIAANSDNTAEENSKMKG